MDQEKIYTTDGKVFSSKFQKLGDICLTERNERILVCNVCKCNFVTPTQFWKHQRDEHGIRDFEDTLRKPHYDISQKQQAMEKQNNGSICGDFSTRKTDRLSNGTERNKQFAELSPIEESDSPLLKMALRQPPKQKTAVQIMPITTTQEELRDELELSSNEENINEFIYFCCPECGNRFQTDTDWKQHITQVHNFFADAQLNISLYKKNPDGTLIYKCDICNVLLNKPNAAPLRRHKLTHMPFKSFCCRLCGTEIRHKSGIVHHLRTVHRKGRQTQLKCNFCHKSFHSALQYTNHVKLHSCFGDICDGFGEDGELLPEGDTSADESFGFPNELSEDCANINYTDDEYDASAFLITEMAEVEDAQDNEMFALTIKNNIKEETPVEIIDTAESYNTLWQEDAALVAEQQMQLAAYQRMTKAAMQPTNASAPPSNEKFECVVCFKSFSSKQSLENHLRSHGTKMDCRRCGVKISSVRSLRTHLDLKRCKFLENQKHNQVNRMRNSVDDAGTVNQRLHSVKEGNTPIKTNVQEKTDHSKNYVTNKAASKPPNAGSFGCKLCDTSHETEISLSLHAARAHQKTDCRLCGVKISTVGALRRHYDLKRCKALK